VERYEAELRALHALSLEAFAENPFYSPIGLPEFERLYLPLRPMIDPSLVRLAEDSAGRLIGYVFAFPDSLAAAEAPRVVLKTLAVSLEARGWGLGAVLADEIHGEAARRGAAVLHALMQVTNASREISRRSESELFRRYVLFEFAGE
jgi:GNAT superfamily N-acetyltransferase